MKRDDLRVGQLRCYHMFCVDLKRVSVIRVAISVKQVKRMGKTKLTWAVVVVKD